MKIEIRKTKTEGIVQITTLDERWYQKGDKFVPSSTWIASYYPKGVGFYKWLAEKGWDEAEALKNEAGKKGSKVHKAIEDLLEGKVVKMDDKYLNQITGEMEELTVQEYEAIMNFVDWHNIVNPITIATEIAVFNDEHNYAGTVDYVCEIKEDVKYGRTEIKKGIYIIDFKTSKSVFKSSELQVSSYKHALDLDGIDNKEVKLGVLQVGYKMNKDGHKFNHIDDKFDLFLTAKEIWAEECADIEPKQKDYPLELKLKITKI